ncbi:MAG: hypothetical protein IJ562_07030 [Prevotella sp.]|nr:hypothetical protein [Prevotella sp.]
MKTKRILLLALIALMSWGFTGCSSDEEDYIDPNIFEFTDMKDYVFTVKITYDEWPETFIAQIVDVAPEIPSAEIQPDKPSQYRYIHFFKENAKKLSIKENDQLKIRILAYTFFEQTGAYIFEPFGAYGDHFNCYVKVLERIEN